MDNINILKKIQWLVNEGEIRISEHGYDELSEDGISSREVVKGLREAIVIENYPDYPKGPCVLVLQRDMNKQPIHVVWGIPKSADTPAVLITAYRPEPERWENDFLRRRK